jgi:hypothetical protein
MDGVITQFKSIYIHGLRLFSRYRLSYYKVIIYIRYIAIKVCLIMMSIFKGEKEKESERVCLPSTAFRPSSPGPSHLQVQLPCESCSDSLGFRSPPPPPALPAAGHSACSPGHRTRRLLLPPPHPSAPASPRIVRTTYRPTPAVAAAASRIRRAPAPPPAAV